MTEQQKSIIRTLREQNFSYNAIADSMGLTLSSVKCYCQRVGLTGNRREAFQSQGDTPLKLPTFCRCCGNQLIQREKTKQRKFCSDECRVTWWNSHPKMVNRRNPHTGICLCYGKEFTWYGPNPHKFCSHGCYIRHRFEGVTYDAEAV